MGEEGPGSAVKQEEDSVVVVSIVEGGYMENPVWVDNNGRIYRFDTTFIHFTIESGIHC